MKLLKALAAPTVVFMLGWLGGSPALAATTPITLPDVSHNSTQVTISGSGSGSFERTVSLGNAAAIQQALQNPNLTSLERSALEHIPTSLTISGTVTATPNGDPVMECAVDGTKLGLVLWQFEANQGYSANGSYITGVAPVNYVGTYAQYGYSAVSETNQMSNPDAGLGITEAYSINKGTFSSLLGVQQTETITFTFHANGNWSVSTSLS